LTAALRREARAPGNPAQIQSEQRS